VDISNLIPKLAVFTGAAVSVFIATGPGIYLNTDYYGWIHSWQVMLFNGTCHQLPYRSFMISEIPMAVCSRCYGFYWGLLAGYPLSHLIPARYHVRKAAITGLIAALGLIASDLIFNMAGLWENTLTSRFITGLFLGSSLFTAIFFNQNK
jgi:uncharacterized membrane protein